MNIVRELVQHETMRSDCFRFLSACFCQPQKSLFLDERLLNNLTNNLKLISPGAAVFSAAMEENILQYSDEDLSVEYARLFIGPFEIKAPPYGSLYLDGTRKVMGDSTMEVIRFYEEAGLASNKDCPDLPDHIAVELEFMSYLIYNETQAMKKSDIKTALELINKQERFFNGFLGRWATAFCEKIRESTDNRFYAALAECTLSFIRSFHPDHVRKAIEDQVVGAI